MSGRIAVCPGSFDPITLGHLDVIERGARVFEELIVAVANNPLKDALFTFQERLDMIEKTIGDLPNVRVEFQMALTNRELNRDVETVFVMSSQDYSFIHASIIKEVVALGGSAARFVPPYVEQKLREKLLPGG